MFKKILPTPTEHTLGVNKKLFIIVHHTGTKWWTINGVLDWLFRRPDYASCHFVVDINGDKYQIWKPDDILWHAWVSSWWKYKDLNNYSIWIEVIWWAGEPFPFNQRSSTKELIQHLMALYNIPKENVLRHKDIASKRKTDISDDFWNNKYKSWTDYQNSLIPKKMI